MENLLRDIWCGLARYGEEDFTRRELVGLAGAAAWAVAAAGCGSRGRSAAERTYLCLAYNESPLGPSEAVLDAIRESIHRPLDTAGINRYPDFLCLDLLGAIAAHNGLGPLNVVTGCGASEIINIAAAAFLGEGDECVMANPSFDLMDVRARAHGATVRRVPLTPNHRHDLDGILDVVGPSTKLVYLCNPNNPTGTILTDVEIADFLDRLRVINADTVVLFDEAYREYVSDAGFPDLASAIADPCGEGIVVARSFSKAYGLAGLRAGYGLAGEATIFRMSGLFTGNFGGPLGWRHPEGNINRVAEAAVLASLADGSGHLDDVIALNVGARAYLYDFFDRFGLACIPSEANFVMADTGRDGAAMRNALCARDVLVQAGGDFHPDYSDFIRVSTGTIEEMERFAAAFEEALDEAGSTPGGRCPETRHLGF